MEGVLDPHTLSMIGRSLIRHGEFVGVIKVDQQRGTLRLARAASWSILGNEDPKSWTYLISLSGPSRQGTIENIPSTGVVRIRSVRAASWHRPTSKRTPGGETGR